MAAAVITCPECEKRFKGKPGLEGKRIRCPACGHGFIVPEDDGEEPEGPSPKKKPPTQAIKAAKPAVAAAPSKPANDDDEGDPKYDITDLDLAPRCPNCTEKLEPGAIICLHCGYNTQTRVLGQTTKTIAKTGGEHFMHLLPGLLVALGMLLLVINHFFMCFVYPQMVAADSWMFMFAHESVKFWAAIVTLGLIWAMGMFAFKRLILEPSPPEEIID